MKEDRNYKTLEYMTKHYEGIRSTSPTAFLMSINDISIMANGGSLSGQRSKLYPCDHHTDQFFVDLLRNLGYNKYGKPTRS